MALNFRLFNCDRTYSLDKVEDLIKKVRPHASVEKEYFPLPRMSELCEKLNKEEKFSGYIVFVVHAHESRLSLNEENAGIGYAKLYRTLLKISDNRVLIVVGGDDNYKGDEHETAFLSQWVWKKIYSQFAEDFLDGTTSFIFSWDKKHQPIHEEALEFYLDPNKPKRKFEPKPRPQSRPVPPLQPQEPKPQPRPLPKLQPEAQQEPVPQPRSQVQSHLQPQSGPQQEPGPQTRPLPQLQPEAQQKPGTPPRPQIQSQPYPGPQSQTQQYTQPGPQSQRPLPQQPQPDPRDQVIYPSVQVLSVLSERVDILRSSVLDVLAETFRNWSSNTPCGPYVPDIRPEHLPRHVKETRPDFVVLLSEYDDLLDVENVSKRQNQFRDLFQAVKSLETTKIIAVVTGDASYKEGDMSSATVEDKVKEINNGILKHDKLIILSWADLPCQLHREVFQNLIGSCRPTEPHQTVVSSIPQCGNVEKGRLRYKAVIKKGCILAVLHSDPFYWKPDVRFMRDALKHHSKKSTIEVWEDNSGEIAPSVVTEEATLRKLLDVDPTEQRHSIQVYSYHSDESTFEKIHTFLKGLGLQYHPFNDPMKGYQLLRNISEKPPTYAAFSVDFEELQRISDSKDMVPKYWKQIQPIIDQLKGIVVMVTGDESNREGERDVSEDVRDQINRLIAGLKIGHKITVMSWEHRPFVIHQETMQKLLKRSQPSSQPSNPPYLSQSPYHYRSTQSTSQQHAYGRDTTYQERSKPHRVEDLRSKREVQTSTQEPEFDPTKGYLRFRAELVYGNLGKVMTCVPPDWYPDQRDLDVLARGHCNTPSAILEFWGHSTDGPPGPPVVKPAEKSGYSWKPSLPSFFCSGKKK